MNGFIKKTLPEVPEQEPVVTLPKPVLPERNVFGGKATVSGAKDMVSGLAKQTMPLLFPSEVKRISELPPLQRQAEVAQSAVDLVMPTTIKAYHGSPYKFKKFSDTAIGKGQGAHAFGHGHYLTDSPQIAQTYATSNAPTWYIGNEKVPDWIGASLHRGKKTGTFNEELKSLIGTFKERIVEEQQALRNPMNTQPWMTQDRLDNVSRIHNMLSKIDETTPIYNTRSIYQTHVFPGKKPSQYTLMDWDKPIAPELREKVNALVPEDVPPTFKWAKSGYTASKQYLGTPAKETGQELYERLTGMLGSEQEASNLLQRAGISGIKYPSGTLSGIKGSPYYNYVIFNPEDIKIKKIKPLK